MLLSNVWADSHRNHSRAQRETDVLDFFKDLKDYCSLAAALVVGWIASLGRAQVVDITDEEREGIEVQIRAFRNALQEITDDLKIQLPDGRRVTITAAELVKACNLIYFTKDGEVKHVQARCVTAHRRSRAAVLAVAIRIKLGYDDPILDIPTDNVTGCSESEIIRQCMLENGLKTKGSRSLGNADYFRIGCDLLTAGNTKADVRKLFQGVPGINQQKMSNLCDIGIRHPDLKIGEGLASGEIPFSSLVDAKLTELRQEGSDDETVWDYLTNPKAGDGEDKTNGDGFPSQMAKKKDVKALLQSNNWIVRLVARQILMADTGGIHERLKDLTPILNAVSGLVEADQKYREQVEAVYTDAVDNDGFKLDAKYYRPE